MAVENPNDLKIGESVQFKTINPHDNLVWSGKITAICDYDTARRFDSIDSYYADVKRVDPTLDAKEALTYLLLNVAENGTVNTIRAFALDFIDKSTLERQVASQNAVFTVYAMDKSKAQDLANYISNLGYVVSFRIENIVTTTS